MTDGTLTLYIGGTHRDYVDYCREHGLNVERHPAPLTALHVTSPRHLEGVHAPDVRIVYGDRSAIRPPALAEIEARLDVFRG